MQSTIVREKDNATYSLKDWNTLRSNTDEIFIIRVHKNRHKNRWKKRLIENLTHHKHAQKSRLSKCTFPQLYVLYASVEAYLHIGTEIRRVRKIINDYMVRGWRDKSYNRPDSFNIKYLYDHRIDRHELGFIAKKILANSMLGQEAKTMINKKMRVIAKNRRSVKHMLVNNKRMIENCSYNKPLNCAGLFSMAGVPVFGKASTDDIP